MPKTTYCGSRRMLTLHDGGLGAIFCGNVVLALPHRTVDDRNIVRFGIAATATAETAGQPHQVGIFEGFVRPGQRSPPHPKPTGTMPHAEVGVQNDPIHAIVAAAQEILIQSAQPICHGGYARRTPAYFKLSRRGHFFAARSAKKRSTFAYSNLVAVIDSKLTVTLSSPSTEELAAVVNSGEHARHDFRERLD